MTIHTDGPWAHSPRKQSARDARFALAERASSAALTVILAFALLVVVWMGVVTYHDITADERYFCGEC